MPNDIIFNLAFLSQVAFISIWLPWKMRKKAQQIILEHPINDYPKLYPRSLCWYESALNKFTFMNAAIALTGLFFWVVYNIDRTNEDYTGVVWAVFMLQNLPYLLLEFFIFQTWKKMRESDQRKTRKASLRPRRISDIIDTSLLVSLVLVFVIFCFFIYWIGQFDHPWFGGVTNIVIIAATYIFMGGIVAWNFYGRSKDPYMDEEDKIYRIRHLTKQFFIICISITLYAMVTISLQVFDLDAYRQLAMTIYCQILVAGYYLTIYRQKGFNFEVYRDEAVAV
jgi:hypothetical protein